jgi:hypothetical protein
MTWVSVRELAIRCGTERSRATNAALRQRTAFECSLLQPAGAVLVLRADDPSNAAFEVRHPNDVSAEDRAPD